MNRQKALKVWWYSVLSAIISGGLFTMFVWFWHITILAMVFAIAYIASLIILASTKIHDTKDKTE